MSTAVTASPAPQAQDVKFALGLGLTNDCNLSCSFCYRDTGRIDRLSLADVRAVIESLPVRSVNLGTGENGLHPEFDAIVAYLASQPLKLTMTSNGYSVSVLSDEQLTKFSDIEFSIDYPTQNEQDAQRGAGNWDLIHTEAARCRRLGVPVTFIAVMMRSNYDRLAAIAELGKPYGAPLRVNVYQSVKSDAFALTYEEYWRAFELLFAETDAIAIGEPLVRAMAGLPPRNGGCGVATVRVTPRATVQPCVYWPGAGDKLASLLQAGPAIVQSAPFALARTLPDACRACPHVAACHGGCAGRRRLQNALPEPDSYCPIVRGATRPLSVRMAASRDLPKLDSACTTIVIAR